MTETEKRELEAFKEDVRGYLRSIPYHEIIELTKKEFPQLASLALMGDKMAMNTLSSRFVSRAAEISDKKKSLTYFSISVFWEDVEKQTMGFKCPKCGSNNTDTAYGAHPQYNAHKGDSFCFGCRSTWKHVF